MSITAAKRLFTVEEYHEMARAGILDEDDRVELLAGEIVEMSPIGSRHAACVNRLNHLLSILLKKSAIVSVQNPIQLTPYSEPQPDLALLKPREDFYANGHPTPEDVFLIIEVAESSVEFDRDVKLPLYAQAGIPEVWIVDLEARFLEVYRNPTARTYSIIKKYKPKERIAPQAFPEVTVDLEDLFR